MNPVFQMWWIIITEVLRPNWVSAVVLLVPVAVVGGAILSWRAKRIHEEGAWRVVGQRIRQMGLLILVSSFLAGGLGLMMVSRDKEEKTLSERVQSRLGGSPTAGRAGLLYDLGASVDVDRLRSALGKFAEQLENQQRVSLTTAWLTTDVGKNITVFLEPLDWPPERIEAYRRETGKLPMLGTSEELALDASQRDLLRNRRIDELMRQMRPAQWSFVLNQLLRPLDHGELVGLLERLESAFPEEVLRTLVNALMEDVARGSIWERFALFFGASAAQTRALSFVGQNSWWIRQVFWLMIPSVAALWLVVCGSGIIGESNRQVFALSKS